MIYLKSLLFGVFAAVVGLVVWVVGSLVVGMARIWWEVRDGAGGLGAVSVGFSDIGLLVGALLPFIAGTAWMYRRLQRRPRGH